MGPYGISTTPNGTVYFASLAGNYVAHIDLHTGKATVLESPTHNQGARRVWPDSHGHLWITEWNVGQLASYDPISKVWKESQLPGNNPMPYAVYVDHKDIVWLSDFGANALSVLIPCKISSMCLCYQVMEPTYAKFLVGLESYGEQSLGLINL